MPKATSSGLFTAINDLRPTGQPLVLNSMMKNIFGDFLIQSGIGTAVANAIANVIGLERDSWFRLWEVKKNTAARVSSSALGYAADDTLRYFFEYRLPDDSTVVLEYSRFEKYEIRGTVFAEDGLKEVKHTDGYAREAVIAMLYAIMLHECSSGGFASIAANFSSEYRSGFDTCGPDICKSYLVSLFNELRDNVDPKKAQDITAPFLLSASCVNKQNGRYKRLLEGEKIGYIQNSDSKVYFASDVEAIPLKESGKSRDVPSRFSILEGILATVKSNAVIKMEENMFPINPDRVLDADDKSRLLTIPEWYVPVPKVLTLAKAVSGSAMFKRAFRSIMMRGPAGSGKTEGARALAAMFGSPYGVVTGHAEMEFFDLTSNLFPNTDSNMDSDAEMYEFLLYALRDSGLKLPSFYDIASMPDSVYEDITGLRNEEAGEAECFAAMVSKLMSICKKDKSMFGGENSKFKVVNSDLTMGFQKGWLVELQEMNTILKPGVLVGLNNILEHGQLRLPTGEIIERHPDTVVVFTQNVGYAGTTDGNQSVYSRIELKCQLSYPTEDEMMGRISMHVPEISEADCRTIVQTVMRVQENCAAEIEGGSVGPREAINWAKMTVLLGGDMRSAAELTILPSVGEDEDNIAMVRENIHQSIEEYVDYEELPF